MINLTASLKLSAIKLEDHSDLFALMSRIYPPAYKHVWKNEDCSFYLNKFYSFENLKKELQEADAEYYFVICNNNYAGILRLQHNKLIEKEKSTYLNRIYLGEEAQGKGIAKLLCDWSESQARRNYSKTIWLKAMDTQEQALRFYAKQGYQVIGKSKLDFSLLHKTLRGMKVFQKIL